MPIAQLPSLLLSQPFQPRIPAPSPSNSILPSDVQHAYNAYHRGAGRGGEIDTVASLVAGGVGREVCPSLHS